MTIDRKRQCVIAAKMVLAFKTAGAEVCLSAACIGDRVAKRVKLFKGEPLETILRQWPISPRKVAFGRLLGVATSAPLDELPSGPRAMIHVRVLNLTARYGRRFQSPHAIINNSTNSGTDAHRNRL